MYLIKSSIDKGISDLIL